MPIGRPDSLVAFVQGAVVREESLAISVTSFLVSVLTFRHASQPTKRG